MAGGNAGDIMFYIVTYDIPEDRRRTRVAKTLLDFGSRVQYSVFECIMDKALLEELFERLSEIAADDDSIRIYGLCAKCEPGVKIIGRGEMTKDEDVFII